MRDEIYYVVFKENPHRLHSLDNLAWVYLQKDCQVFQTSFVNAYKFRNLEVAKMFAEKHSAFIIAYDY